MAFGSKAAARVDVEFVAETGTATANVKQFESVYQRTTAQLSNEALRMQVAQEKLNRTIARSGPESTAAKQATLAYRREVEALEREANQAARALDRDQRELSQLARGAAVGTGALHGFTRTLAYASAGFLGSAGLVAGFRSAIGAASDLNEQTTKAEQVFSGSAEQVLAWGKTTANAIGIADDKAIEAAGTFGNLFNTVHLLPAKNAELSRSLVELAADLASFNNASPGETLEALRSGVIGEAEPLRRFGVLLSEARVKQEALRESGKKNADELTDQEKLLARVSIIFRDTAKAQGDFARTSDGTANQQREANAHFRDTAAILGQTLEPAYNHALHTLNEWLGDTKNQQRLQRDLNAVVKTGGQVAHGLADGIDAIHTVTGPLIDALGGLENVIEAALIAGFVTKAAKAARALGGIGAAEKALTTVVVAESTKQSAAMTRAFAAGGKGAPVVAVGKGGGTFFTALLAWLGYGYVFPQGISGVGKPIASDVLGDNGSPFPKGSPNDADYQRAFKRSAASARGIGDASDRAAAGPGFQSSYGVPSRVSGTTPGTAAPAALRAQALALARSTPGTADDIAALRAQQQATDREIAFWSRRGTTPQAVAMLTELYGRAEQNRSQLLAIAQDDAAKEKAAADKAKAARAKREAARKEMIEALIPNAIRGAGDADPRLLASLQLAAGRQIGAALVPGRIYRAAATSDTREAVARLREGRLDLELARIDNRALEAQLTKTLSDDKTANRLLIDFWRRRKQEAEKGTLEREQARQQWLQALLARKAFAGDKSGSGATAAEFYAEAASELRTYGSNIGARGAPLAGQDGRALLGQIAIELREIRRHSSTTAQGTTSLARGHRTPADEARLAAVFGY